MKITLLFFVSFLLINNAKAQDTTLPQGNSRIYFYSGKSIKHIRLWHIDTLKVEYVAEGNLGDVKTLDVMKIETPACLLTFDEAHHLVKRHFDCIIPYYGDTLWGIIKRTDEESIEYIPVGSSQSKTMEQSNVKSYVQWDDKTPTLKREKEKHSSASIHSATTETNIPERVVKEKTATPETQTLDEKNVYILHKEIGPVIIGWQKSRYNLFPEIKDNDFASARLYSSEDATITAKIFLADGSVQQRTVTKSEIKFYRQYIDQREERSKVITGLLIGLSVAYVGVLLLTANTANH